MHVHFVKPCTLDLSRHGAKLRRANVRFAPSNHARAVAVPRVTAAHGPAVRERIVAAALRVFAERGFHGATMQDVVHASGLSVGAIYTYFGSKAELFLASCELTSEQAVEELM